VPIFTENRRIYLGASISDTAANSDDGTCLFSESLDSKTINDIAWTNVDTDRSVTVTDFFLILAAFV
tara:strand:- start:2377 stop:2577 length:201 start_codon:yes stop_codon:yes gene_type:complete